MSGNVINLAAYKAEKLAQEQHEEEMRLRELIDRSMAYSYKALYGIDLDEEDKDAD
jgi:hypothetical protein